MTAIELTTTKIRAAVDEHGIGWVTFNNPARHNALSLEMWQGLADALERMQHDSAVRVAVMSGAGGKAFVSGADISEFGEKRATAAQKETYAETAGRANRALARFEKPLLAMIAGYCIGGGLATSLAADVRFASPDSKFGIPAAKLGLGYDYDGIAKLARLVGPSRARDILFSARTLDADEALRIGLIDFIVPRETLNDEVVAYARRIAANAPLTIRAAKAAVAVFERGGRSDEIAEVQRKVNACFDSDDYKEGRRAFMEKRPPRFNGK
jgi:enoyl-CoA hydratase/carnithine racemase